jgi:hypothetical protein
MTKVQILCSVCGSADVSRDAWADWDVAKQKWVLRVAFDYAHCHRCDTETQLVEAELAL